MCSKISCYGCRFGNRQEQLIWEHFTVLQLEMKDSLASSVNQYMQSRTLDACKQCKTNNIKSLQMVVAPKTLIFMFKNEEEKPIDLQNQFELEGNTYHLNAYTRKVKDSLRTYVIGDIPGHWYFFSDIRNGVNDGKITNGIKTAYYILK